MASARRALPSAPRCERPSGSVCSKEALQPGGLAHGPEEKYGLAGRVVGFAGRTSAPASAVSVNSTLLAESTRRVGTAWPAAAHKPESGRSKAVRKIRVLRCTTA